MRVPPQSVPHWVGSGCSLEACVSDMFPKSTAAGLGATSGELGFLQRHYVFESETAQQNLQWQKKIFNKKQPPAPTPGLRSLSLPVTSLPWLQSPRSTSAATVWVPHAPTRATPGRPEGQ